MKELGEVLLWFGVITIGWFVGACAGAGAARSSVATELIRCESIAKDLDYCYEEIRKFAK